MSGPVATLVEELIASSEVFIFSRTTSESSSLVKLAFIGLKVNFSVIELDRRDDGESILSCLAEMTESRTVPQVFVKRECIGGYSEVMALYESGRLQEMLF